MRMEKGPNIFQDLEDKGEKTELKKNMEAYYDSFPKRREVGNHDSELAKQMTLFLIDQEYINEIQKWNSWGCKYENGTILVNEQPMSQENQKHYIFRLGENSLTGEHLFPKIGEGVGGEVDAYRFIHESSHAYQDWRRDKDRSDRWFEKAISNDSEENSSPMERIFKFCYDKRENKGFGLSTWGNIPEYDEWAKESENKYLEGKDRNEENIEKAIDYGLKNERCIRSWEDLNELATMYLWHPEYLNTFLEYLSGDIDGYGVQDLKNDGYVKITKEEKDFLKKNILEYIEEMKENIE